MRIVTMKGKRYVPADWRETAGPYWTVINDNRRERADNLKIILQAKADLLAKQL